MVDSSQGKQRSKTCKILWQMRRPTSYSMEGNELAVEIPPEPPDEEVVADDAGKVKALLIAQAEDAQKLADVAE